MRLVLSSLVLALTVGVLAAAPAQADARHARGRVRIAEVDAAAAAKATGGKLASVRTAEKRRASMIADRTEIAARYQRELAEIDKLKKQKASWRRDRQLRSKLAASLETAKALGAASADITAQDVTLLRLRKALLKSIDAELKAGPGEKRQATLRTLRTDVSAQVAPRKVKKIVVPDDELDPLADPEELDLQAKALRDSEAELAKQIAILDKQATRFKKQAELRKQHERADEMATRDDSQPRRTTSAGGRSDDAAEPTGDEDALGEDGPAADPGNFEGDPAVVLSDVVDGETVDALRKAERSSDPAAKAAAADRARAQVQKRLRALEKRRKEIEKRARELRE